MDTSTALVYFILQYKNSQVQNSIILNDLSLPVTLHIVMRNLLPMQPDPCLKNIYKNARYKEKNKT